ncbi:MAG TPA: NAD(P)/FAD-dependent oxidoreductase [Gemmatimonadaceae bacterium]|nr:NAD(P)/FAD-dependent oxidoreductase [Gemmatimonadaceae bacterium]
MASHVDVLIIGSGFSGIGMGVKLKQAGLDSFVILERGPDVGGTWRINTYPGCACDVPSHLYSFSYEKNAGWSRMYPTQVEIWDYLKGVTAKHGLRPSMRFDSEVREAVFDEHAGRWRVTTQQGSVYSARVVTSCMGGLSRPQLPKVPGIDRFEGPAFHSSLWDHSVDMAGKRIGVIGTGASAIQFVPQIVPRVAKLHLFQRTPPWILPKPDRPIHEWERSLFRGMPGYMWAFRNWLYWRQEIFGIGYTLKPQYLKFAERIALNYLREAVHDPALRAKLTPNYRIGCKRVLLTNDYLQSLSQPNVEVVTDGVAEVRERSIVTTDGVEREVDAIVYGTGFRTLDFTSPVRFVGPGGAELNEVWKTRPQAYLGVATAGFPNLFFITGPNSRVANNSIVFMIEAQIRYVIDCLTHLRASGAATMSVTPQAQERFNAGLTARAKRTVFATGCKSWYLDEKGESPVLWPGFSSEYWWKSRRIELGDYVLV